MRTSSFAFPVLLALALAVASGPAGAAKKRGPGKPTPDRTAENCKDLAGDALDACKLVGKYLDLWKQQKWGELKKLIHPKTHEAIAQTKKNTGDEHHGMAPWYWAKSDYLLTDWKLVKVEESESGTLQVHTSETWYRVVEDGISEAEEAAYLAGKHGGTWTIANVQRGGGGFEKASIKAGYKGYFDPPPAKEGAEAK